MPRHLADMDFSKSELPPTEELYNRKFRRSGKSIDHRSKRHNYQRDHLCVNCELPTYETLPIDQERRRKKQTSKIQHCPSCNCQTDFNKHLYDRYMKSMEAMLEKYENYLANPDNSAMKRSKSPFSLPSGMHSRLTEGIHCSKRGQNSEQNQSSKTEYSEELHTMFLDMINSGITDENTEIPDKSSYKKEHCKEDDQVQCNQEESELDSDCSKKTFTNHCHLKKDKVGSFEKSRESIEKCEIERDEEQNQANCDCEELNQLTLEVQEYEKLKGRRSNFSEKNEQKQIRSRKEGDIQKKKTKFNKLAISHSNEFSTDQNIFVNTGTHRRHKIEPSTSYNSLPKDDKDFDNNVEGDFFKQGELQQELKANPSSKITRCSVVQNSQTEKSEKNNAEIMSLTNENEFKSKEEALTEDRKHLYAGGDLHLHACKSYIVELIDRALSKQLGTQPCEKKVDLNKNSPSWQEMCFEVTRALQGDYCQSFAQNLYNFQENMDNVKLLKRFRWAYVKHIQEQLRSLEKIIDICSPRHTQKESATS